MKKTVSMAFLAVIVMAGQVSEYIKINVVESRPLYREVTIQTPERECWEEEVREKDDSDIGAVLGGITGGILGHQVGGGSGKTAATVGGAIVGTIVGKNLAEGENGTQVVKRCRTVYKSRKERRLVGYENVGYLPNGTRIIKKSPHPLKNIEIRVTYQW